MTTITTENVKKSEICDLECQRCCSLTDVLYKHYRAKDFMTYIYEDSNEPIPDELREEIWVCYDCDWEVPNGHSMDDDAVEIQLDREERNYEEDPLWYDCPY